MSVLGKKDLITKYAETVGIAKSVAEVQVNTMLDCIKDCLLTDGLSIKGMFTISPTIKKGREGIVNGKEFKTEDKKSLKMKVSQSLVDELNND